MSHAYAAGLIDGEGYIGVKETATSYAIRLKVGMTDKAEPCLSRLEASYGGKTTPYQPRDANRRRVLEWRLNGQEAAVCLRLIRPHLIVKAAIADLALQLQDMIDAAPRRGNGQAVWSEEMRKRGAVLRLRVMELNQVGPKPEPPSLPQEKPLAIHRWGEWWEPDEDLFGPVEFTGRFPTSGTMIAGHIYPLSVQIPASAMPSGLLPTPMVADSERTTAYYSGGNPTLTGALLPTPESSDASGGRISSEMGGTRPSGAKRAITLATALSHGVSTSPQSAAGSD